MKRTTLIIGALIIMLTAVLVSSPSDGLAAHYTFLQENPSARGGLFNWTFVGWALTPYPTDWDDDGSYTQHIRNAISTWETAVPQLDFYEEPDDWNYLYFANGRCVIGVACLSVDETDWEGERGAHYLLWGTITMDIDGNNFTDLGKEDILRHEIGHWIGLDEAYNEGSSTSCSTIQSVMNATRHGTGENCVGVHAPTQRDISAVTKLKPRWDVHLSGDDDQLGCAGKSLSSVLGE